MFISDLHIHSKFSRATSKDCDLEHLEMWARKKGIHILGTGDFTHPLWQKEMREKLEPAEDGFYRLKREYQISDGFVPKTITPRFVITGEISSVYKKDGKTRRVHSLLLLPNLDTAEKLAKQLEKIGNIHSDGRPILSLPCKNLLEMLLEITEKGIYVPAHIWTPHFSMMGEFSAFSSPKECFEELTPYIHAVETGLSSDPAMNWRVSALENMQFISNSDAHSPSKLGREANLMEIEMSYAGLEKAIQTGEGLYGTIEFYPEEGKYHLDGHRKCQICFTPQQTREAQGKCPVCGKKLTVGVLHRIEELADKEEGYVKAGAKPFEKLIPLMEIIAEDMGYSTASKRVFEKYQQALLKLGTEFEILREIPLEDIKIQLGENISEGISHVRKGEVQCRSGFDGEYGKIKVL